MKLTTAIIVSSLAASTSASILDNVKATAQTVLEKFVPLKPAVQIPCCGGTNCPYCPRVEGNNTASLLSISYPSANPENFEGHPPGCGKGFTADDCLRFMVVTFTGLDTPLKLAAEKAGCISEGRKLGCGEESTPGDCLRYLKEFFKEIQAPLERTLDGGGAEDSGEENGNGGGSGYGYGKSEL